MEDQKPIIVCIPIRPGFEPVPGSTMLHCHVCGDQVWLSPHGIEFLSEEPLATLQCIACIGTSLDEIPVENMSSLPNESPEMKEWMRRNIVRIRSYFRRQATNQERER